MDFDDFGGLMMVNAIFKQTHGFGRWISSRASLLPLVTASLWVTDLQADERMILPRPTPNLLADWWGNQ